jgi:hypothetical protein
MTRPYSVLIPSQSPLVTGGAGQPTMDWRQFFNQLVARCGPSIAHVDTSAPTSATMTQALNTILSEMRAQRWIEPQSDGAGSDNATFASVVRAITMIPAAGDFVYNTTDVQVIINGGVLNQHMTTNTHVDWDVGPTDFSVSLTDLRAQLPNVKTVSLFVGWFGDDLRCGQCAISPRIDTPESVTGRSTQVGNEFSTLIPFPWRVAGWYRNQVPVISTVAGSPAYGSTPADSSVIEGIQALKAAGFAVAFTPFIFMDVPMGSTLPSPYGGTQAAYPWRGRITCDPAPGVAGTPDRTPAVLASVAAFVTTYRTFILHCASLCASAGGVDIFVIGSEMRGMTWIRSSATEHPFVDALVELAADVKSTLPDAKLVYTADWSEWNNYVPPDGSGDVIFHLDKIYSDPNIHAIGIDNYMPLSDWRVTPVESPTNVDSLVATSIYDWGYLTGNVAGGELYDWYYASSSDRYNQIRTPITDGAYGKPWVYRAKDIRSWWENQHFNRVGGIEAADPTSWVPRSKPVWFMETGAPAVDKGSNQPNVFIDPKSSESFYPYFSTGARDDSIQRRFSQAVISHYTDEKNNPYGMVDINLIFLYTWDARPAAVFPALSGLWADAPNWALGDWLTGRIPIVDAASLPVEGSMNMSTVTITAPFDSQIVDPATGKMDRNGPWFRYLQSLGYTRQPAIASLGAEATSNEIAEKVNEILSTLAALNKIQAVI